MALKHAELTEQIIAAFYVVYNSLGYGFLEKVYRNALAQLTNYLQATAYEVGLVLNFGPKPTFERRFYSNENKKQLKKNQ